MFKHQYVIAAAAFFLLGAPGALGAQSTGTTTGQGFYCDKEVCVCVGKADCKKLIGTGWCNDRLECTSQRCECKWLLAPGGSKRPTTVKPTTKQ